MENDNNYLNCWIVIFTRAFLYLPLPPRSQQIEIVPHINLKTRTGNVLSLKCRGFRPAFPCSTSPRGQCSHRPCQSGCPQCSSLLNELCYAVTLSHNPGTQYLRGTSLCWELPDNTSLWAQRIQYQQSIPSSTWVLSQFCKKKSSQMCFHLLSWSLQFLLL